MENQKVFFVSAKSCTVLVALEGSVSVMCAISDFEIFWKFL